VHNRRSDDGLRSNASSNRRFIISPTASARGFRAKSLAGRTITVRVRFADLRAVTRSLTLSAPISATRALADIAEDLVRGVLADHRDEKTISLLAISVSNLDAHAIVQLELPLGLAAEGCRPGTRKAWRDRAQTRPSMRSASASEDKRWIMGGSAGCPLRPRRVPTPC
jgi:hypothetical protein